MKNKHEYGNQLEGYSEEEEEISEDVNFKKDNMNAKAAFLIDQRHNEVSSNAKLNSSVTDPDVEVVVITDVVDRRTRSLNNRRTVTHDDRRTGTLDDRRTSFYDRRNIPPINQGIDVSYF